MCYQSACVLGSVTSISLSIGVTNPATSTVTFSNVNPTLVSPVVWNTAMGTMTAQTLAPGQTYTWIPVSGMLTGQFEGTTQTFSTTITGTNAYTGAAITQSTSVSLTFKVDPTGAFTVSILSPV